jgi:Ca2+/Na+ antiporter
MVSQVLGLAFLAALNPSLLAAVTVMLLLPSPKRLLFGYLLGAYMTSITLGLVIVFSFKNSSSVSTSKNTISPGIDIGLGVIALVIAYVLYSGRAERLAERRKARKAAKEKGKEKKESLPQRLLGRGSAKATFVVGALLSFPGVSYLTALDRIVKGHFSTTESVLLVIGFNLIMMVLLELPLLGYAISPDRTRATVERFKAWLSRNGYKVATYGFAVVGAVLTIRGVIEALN